MVILIEKTFKENAMKVLNHPLEIRADSESTIKSNKSLDLTLCTRCHHPWGFELVERIEMWSCDNCGYEAREKSVDFFAMQLAEQESLLG